MLQSNTIGPKADWSDDEYNQEWVLADNVIKYLLKQNPHIFADWIAKTMRQPVHKIKEAMMQLSELKPHLFSITESKQNYLGIVRRDNEGLRSFLYDEGGFTAIYAASEADRLSETTYREAEFRKIHLEIELLKKESLNQKTTRRLSLLAILISILLGLLPYAIELVKRI